MAVALILAAGTGERLGADRPKALVELAGKSLLERSLRTLREADGIDRIVVAMPLAHEHASEVSEYSIAMPSSWNAIAVPGGATRSESVRLALAVAGPGDPVLVHDAARPLVTAEIVAATLAAVEREGVDAAIAAAPLTDTIKRAGSALPVVLAGGHLGEMTPGKVTSGEVTSGEMTHGEVTHGEPDPPTTSFPVVSETLDRTGLWAVQTPQVFRREALERALEVPDEVLAQATDDAWLVERAGGCVVIVPAPPENLKVTTPLDLALAELLVARREK